MSRIKIVILVPFVVFICALVSGVSGGVFWLYEKEDASKKAQTLENIQGMFRRHIQYETNLIDGILHVVVREPRLEEAFLRRDRETLYEQSESIFNELKQRHQITHFYFTDTERVNFLRVHQPQRHGDRIGRHTTLMSQQTGHVASGVELGPLGTFTLRVVMPWRTNGKVIGYLEMGKEIDKIFSDLEDELEVEVFVFLYKTQLERDGWLTGMRMLDRLGSWTQFSDVVLANRSASDLPEGMVPNLIRALQRVTAGSDETMVEGKEFHLVHFPLVNTYGDAVGLVLAAEDLGELHQFYSSFIRNVIITGIVVGVLLVVMFWIYLGRIEGNLQRAEKGLLSEKLLSEEYINSLPGLFYVFDEQRFVRWNREWNRITGYNDEELGSRYGTDFFEGEDRRLIGERMRKVFREGTAEVEAELVTKDGRRLPYYFTGLRKKMDGGDHLIGLGIDITELKQAEAEMDRLQRELQQVQKMEAVGQLTGGIAHDFNNILGIILGFAEIAYNQCISSGQTKTARYLNNIHKAGNRAAALVSQMLAFSRKEGGEYQYNVLQLVPLIKEDIKMLRSTLPTSIDIKTKFEDHLPEVLTDPTQLHQALMNLAINARDAMDGAGTLTICLGWTREMGTECSICHQQVQGDWVELSVSDTGTGIEPEIIEHIFNPFFTTKEVGKGTGMGLAVILGIIRRHGGHVLVESQPGSGTTFRLLFPGRRGEHRNGGEAQMSKELPKGYGELVLVVDDEPDLGEFIGGLLEHYGYRAKVLTSSKKALELFKEKPNEFALVITDQTMPGITGTVLVKGLREVRPDIPVVLNTGFSEDIDAEAAARMGIRYLEKPVGAESLIQVVGELLRPTEQGAE